MKKLNPYARLSVSKAMAAMPATEADLEEAQIVVLGNGNVRDKVEIGNLCRSSNAKLMCVDSHGMVHSVIVDVGDHTYKHTVTIGRKDQEPKKIESIETCSTPRIEEIFNGGWEGAALKEGRKQSSMPALANLSIDAAILDGNLKPCPEIALAGSSSSSSSSSAASSSESGDGTVPTVSPDSIAAIEAERAAWGKAAAAAALAAAEKRGLAGAGAMLSPFLEAACRGYRLDYAPVGSISGGVLAREISKIVTQTDAPFTNVIGIDGLRMEAKVGKVPLSAKSIEAAAAKAREQLLANAGDAMSLDDSSDDEDDAVETVGTGNAGSAGQSAGTAAASGAGSNGTSAKAADDDDDDSDDDVEIVSGPGSSASGQAEMES